MAVKRTIKKSAEANEVLLKDVFEEYVLEKEARNTAESTINNYRYSFGKLVDFIGNDPQGKDIDIKLIYKWIATMKGDGIKHTSINHYLRDNRAFFNWCFNVNRRYIDPAFVIDTLKGQEEPLKHFSDEEQLKLLEKPKNKNDFVECRTYTIVCFVLDSGSRASTICNVKVSDVDFANHHIVLAHTKNKKAQVLPMSSAFETILKDYIRTWRKYANTSEYLFCNQGEGKLTTNALRLSFGRYCRDRGVEKTSIHGLRHSFARGYIKNNGNSLTLQKILGHATLEMTRKYVSLYNSDICENYNSYSPLGKMKQNMSRTKTVQQAF